MKVYGRSSATRTIHMSESASEHATVEASRQGAGPTCRVSSPLRPQAKMSVVVSSTSGKACGLSVATAGHQADVR